MHVALLEAKVLVTGTSSDTAKMPPGTDGSFERVFPGRDGEAHGCGSSANIPPSTLLQFLLTWPLDGELVVAARLSAGLSWRGSAGRCASSSKAPPPKTPCGCDSRLLFVDTTRAPGDSGLPPSRGSESRSLTASTMLMRSASAREEAQCA